MITRISIYLIAIILISCSTACGSHKEYSRHQQLSFALHTDGENQFKEEKLKVLQRTPQVNFENLRISYTQTKHYLPWDTVEHEASVAMLNAQEDQNYLLCFKLAKAIIEKNFVSIDGHYGAFSCGKSLKNNEAQELHGYILKGLIQSIKNSGDGKSIESAYKTISLTEMRAFIRATGLTMYRQENVIAGAKQIDLIYCLDPISNESISLYFDNTPARMHIFKRPTLPGF